MEPPRKRLGRPRVDPTDETRFLELRLPARTHDRLRVLASRQGTTMSQVARASLRFALRHWRDENED